MSKSTQSHSTTLNRRGFLEASAAATFSIMAASTAFGSTANSKIKAGVVGLGGRGRMITAMVRDHGGYELTAVADYFEQMADGVGRQFNIDEKNRFSGLSGYKRLIESGVEAVFLETPPYCFPEHATAAVDAGKHVYMAKPVACDVPGCMMVQSAGKKATDTGKVFLIDFQTRTDPANIEGIRRLHDGEIGPIGIIRSRYTDDGFPDPPFTENVESRLQKLIWVNDIHLGGGYLVNAGIHAVDMALWMARATPISATGASKRTRKDPHGDSHDVYSVTYEFADGLIISHFGEHVNEKGGFHCDCSAHGQTGYLDTTYGGEVKMPGAKEKWAGGLVENLYQQGAIRNIATFHQNITEGNCSNLTIAPSIAANLATLLGQEACMRGTKITWGEFLKENKRIEPNLTGLKA